MAWAAITNPVSYLDCEIDHTRKLSARAGAELGKKWVQEESEGTFLGRPSVSVWPVPCPNATVIQAGIGTEPIAIQLARPTLYIAPASAGYRAADLAVCAHRNSSE